MQKSGLDLSEHYSTDHLVHYAGGVYYQMRNALIYITAVNNFLS